MPYGFAILSFSSSSSSSSFGFRLSPKDKSFILDISFV